MTPMFYFFPGNYMWSQAAFRALSSGGAVGEVAQAVGELQDAAQTYDNEAWYRVWNGLGHHLWHRGEWEAEADHPRSARDSFLRASCYYLWALSFMSHTDKRRAAVHQRAIEAFGRHAALCAPPIARVEVPYEGTTLAAWLVRGRGAEARNPTVIYLPGLDSTKEQGLEFARVLAEHGFHTLLPDGPGVGETLLFQGLVNRHDYEVPATAMYEYVTGRPDVDAERVAVVGVSLGGYRAPRAAAFEHRFAACVAWGGIWDYGAVWERRRANERGTVPVPHEHMLWVLGARDLDEVSEKLRPWKLDDVAQQIRCPMLVTHDEKDAQVPLENAYKLYEAAGAPQKELKIFTEVEGGAAHCQNDNRLLAHSYIADWLEDTLVRGRPRHGVIVGLEQPAA
jgi:dienelactone hydrolase